jgi:hypothetical protein
VVALGVEAGHEAVRVLAKDLLQVDARLLAGDDLPHMHIHIAVFRVRPSCFFIPGTRSPS